jgi:hypothetical protein
LERSSNALKEVLCQRMPGGIEKNLEKFMMMIFPSFERGI